MPRGASVSEKLLGECQLRRPWLEQRQDAAKEQNRLFLPARSHLLPLSSPDPSVESFWISLRLALVFSRQSHAHTIQPAPRNEPPAYIFGAPAPSPLVPFVPPVPAAN